MFGNASLVILLISIFGIPEIVLAEEGKSIGSLYQCAHDLRGEVFVKNEREILIKGFNYDGKGPAAWFHGQLKGAKGVYTSDGNFQTLPYPNATCDRLKPGRSYKDEDVTVILPVSIKEFETIGVFCYQYCHNFGHIVIPADLEVPAAPAGLLEVNECPKPSYKTCTLDQTKGRNGLIKPDCPAGAAHIVPSVLVTISAVLAISMALKN